MIDIMKQGLGAPHAPTRALRKLTRVEEFWWAVQDSNSTAPPQAGQQNGPAPANSTKPGTFSGPMAQKGFRVSDFALFLCASCYRIFILFKDSHDSLRFFKETSC